MSNLVQELVQEMGPGNPALNYNAGMPPQAGYDQGYYQNQMMDQRAQMPQMYHPGTQGMGSPVGPGAPPMGPPGPGMAHGGGQGGYMGQLPSSPVGQEYPDDDEMQEMMDLEHFGIDGGHQSFTDRLLDQGREALFLAIVFLVLSLPQTDRFIQKNIPRVASNFYYLLAFKGLVLGLLNFLAKYFELV